MKSIHPRTAVATLAILSLVVGAMSCGEKQRCSDDYASLKFDFDSMCTRAERLVAQNYPKRMRRHRMWNACVMARYQTRSPVTTAFFDIFTKYVHYVAMDKDIYLAFFREASGDSTWTCPALDSLLPSLPDIDDPLLGGE